MERLTDKELVKKLKEHYYGDYDKKDEAYLRLAELEDEIENGKLTELPCRVGDTVYWVDSFADCHIEEETVKSISVEECGIKVYVISGGYFWLERFGVCCFTEQSKAEEKLKELKEQKK